MVRVEYASPSPTSRAVLGTCFQVGDDAGPSPQPGVVGLTSARSAQKRKQPTEASGTTVTKGWFVSRRMVMVVTGEWWEWRSEWTGYCKGDEGKQGHASSLLLPFLSHTFFRHITS